MGVGVNVGGGVQNIRQGAVGWAIESRSQVLWAGLLLAPILVAGLGLEADLM